MLLGPIATFRVGPHELLTRPALDIHGRVPQKPHPVLEDVIPGAEVDFWLGRWFRAEKVDAGRWPEIQHFQVRISYHSAWRVPQEVPVLGATYSDPTMHADAYASRERLVELGRAVVAEAVAREELRPEALAKITWYQLACAGMASILPWMFIRIAPGGGKTFGATAAALVHPGDVVVLCPSKARKEWRTEPGRKRSSLEKFTLLESHVVLPRSERPADYEGVAAYVARMRECGERAFVVVGMEALADYMDDIGTFQPTTLVIDEVHDLGDHQRWSMVMEQGGGERFERLTTDKGNAKRSVAAMDLSRLLSIRRRIVMTGTPLDDGRPRRLWAPLDLLAPGTFGRYGSYRQRYCNLSKNAAGYMDDSGTSNMEELKARCSMFMLDVSRAETHASLPPMRLEVEYLKPHQINAPDAFVAEMKRLAKDAGRTDFRGMEARMLLKEAELAMACSTKRVVVRERAKEFLSTGGKVVVLLSRIAMAEKWFEQWQASFGGVQGWLATGHVSEKERDRIIDTYAEHPGPCYIIGTGHSIGTSKDGMQHSDLAVIAQLPEKPGWWLQWLGRFDRLGGRSPIVWVPVAEGSADDKEVSRLIRKLGPLERFMDAPELRDMADKLGGLDDPDLLDSVFEKLMAGGLQG